jgi:FAD:protein FMN transferase
MGSDAHVIVVGGPGLALEAERRIADLESRWSRFDPCSEVSALTRYAGSPVVVSAETRELVEHAIAAWRFTRGLFDPTVLGALEHAGYDRSFDDLPPNRIDLPLPNGARDALGTGAIEVDAHCVRLPAGTGFDAGGIGKGLAADIVVDEILALGAEGACVNLGGDVRAAGTSPSGNTWTVSVDHPEHADAITRIGISSGAVATSTTLRRQWLVDGERRHHLIDPGTGRPSESDLAFVTVVDGQAWMAEVLAKAILLHGTPGAFGLLDSSGAAAIAVDYDGRITSSPGMAAYLAEPLPDRVRARIKVGTR